MEFTQMQLIHQVKEAQEKPGVYALWCQEGRHLSLLSVHPSGNIKISLLIYHQAQRWRTQSANRIVFSACYTPQLNALQRDALAKNIRRRAWALYTSTPLLQGTGG